MKPIVVKDLFKTFYTYSSGRTLRQAVKGLFYRKKRAIEALKGLSFAVDQGQIVGFIGPNGAGKSTCIKILSGILVPSSGHVHVLGMTPWKERIKVTQSIGVVFGQRSQLAWDLPCHDSFELLKSIYNIEQENYEATMARLVKKLSLEDLLDIPVRQLSLGQRMRCELAAALLHSPKVLFLDEPTIGLDAASKLAVRAFIRELHYESNLTVLLTTHDLDDIESLCDRVVVIDRGELFHDGSLEALRSKVTQERYLILDLEEDKSFQLSEKMLSRGVKVVKKQSARLWLGFDPGHLPAAELIAEIAQCCSFKDLFVENLPIEEIVAELYRRR